MFKKNKKQTETLKEPKEKMVRLVLVSLAHSPIFRLLVQG